MVTSRIAFTVTLGGDATLIPYHRQAARPPIPPKGLHMHSLKDLLANNRRWAVGYRRKQSLKRAQLASPALATGGASVQDIFSPIYMPLGLCLWVVAAYQGPGLGPTIVGFAVQKRPRPESACVCPCKSSCGWKNEREEKATREA